MENTINQRIDTLISALNKNHKTFAESLGKAPTIIYNVVSGRNKPGYDLLELICEKHSNVSRDWLLMGEGDIFRETKEEPRPDGYLQEHLRNLEKQFAEMREMFSAELNVKNRQIEKLMDLLGKLDVGENTTCKIVEFWPPVGAQIA